MEWVSSFNTLFLIFLTIIFSSAIINPQESNISILPYEEEGNAEEDFLLVRRGALPPFTESRGGNELARDYKFQDFLWTGSGDGPFPSEEDEGISWVDNGGGGGGEITTNIIRVTKTLVLYHTIRTTVLNPIEYTPTVVSFTVEPTPSLSTKHLEPSPSPSLSSDLISPSRSSEWPIELSSTPFHLPTPQPNHEKTTPFDEGEEEGEASGTTTNPRYWVQTVIRADGNEIQRRQRALQQGLAKVYASAFKRELLNSLGVKKSSALRSSSNDEPKDPRKKRRRRRNAVSYPAASESEDVEEIELNKFIDREEIDLAWLLLGGQSTNRKKVIALASTIMNVSVSIFNISTDPARSYVIMHYVVCAEGTPIPASFAVNDLRHVTKREMENQIGYEVINKAEALVADHPDNQGQVGTSGTSPWLIVAVTTMTLLVVLTVVIIFMVWKWKHNRLVDTGHQRGGRGRTQSGIEGGGVVNPSFVGPPSPIERSEVHFERKGGGGMVRRKNMEEEEEEEKRRRKIGKSESDPSRRRRLQSRQEALASDLNTLLVEDVSPSSASSGKSQSSTEERSSGSLLRGKGGGGRRKRREKTFTPSPKLSGRGEKISKKRGSQKSSSENGDKGGEPIPRVRKSSRESLKESPSSGEKKLQFPQRLITPNIEETLSRGLGKSSSLDQISYGHLDLCQDNLARTPSEAARKIMGSRPTSSQIMRGTLEDDHARKRENERTIDEISDLVTTGSRDSAGESGTKEAGVQTPTRRGKVKKVVTSPMRGHRRRGEGKRVGRTTGDTKKPSSESLLSTESEEIIEVHRIPIDSSSSDSNPLGRMRKRFHQFLDDAFNVMGKREGDVEEGRAKSAKVSISHEIQRRQPTRPWTSTLREETLSKLRPRSASIGGPGPGLGRRPKRAWTASSERRCQSAKFPESQRKSSGGGEGVILEREEGGSVDGDDDPDVIYSEQVSPQPVQFTSHAGGPIYPNYPLYPDLPMQGSSPRKPSTSAAPLIQAIKEEISRFENKSSELAIRKTLQNLSGSEL